MSKTIKRWNDDYARATSLGMDGDKATTYANNMERGRIASERAALPPEKKPGAPRFRFPDYNTLSLLMLVLFVFAVGIAIGGKAWDVTDPQEIPNHVHEASSVHPKYLDAGARP